jgi:phosphate:Na+ symporter
VAVGLYSTVFNIFNTLLLFPFTDVFARVLARVGHSDAENVEDYSQARFLDPDKSGEPASGVPLVQQEMVRYTDAAKLFLSIARKEKLAPDDAAEHYAAIDVLNRDIRRYTAAMFKPDMPRRQTDLLASLIEEEDFTASLGETLYQIARRMERHEFSAAGRQTAMQILDQVSDAMNALSGSEFNAAVAEAARSQREQFLLATREHCLGATELTWEERGAILALLGSAERAFFLIERVDAERRSVPRTIATVRASDEPGLHGGMALAPGE